MFKHLLVSTDGSVLSQDTVGRALSFSSEAGARITFFYAEPESPAIYAGMRAISNAHITQEMIPRLEALPRTCWALQHSWLMLPVRTRRKSSAQIDTRQCVAAWASVQAQRLVRQCQEYIALCG